MSAPHATQIVEGYVARLEVALAGAPSVRRRELIEDVRSHMAEARAALETETDADLLAVVDRLGDPEDLAREAAEQVEGTPPPPAVAHWGWLELGAVLLSIVMWPAGAILAWLSSVWTTRDKLVATALGAVAFVVGFPLFAPVVGPLLGPLVRSLGPSAPVLVGTLGALPLASAIYLAFRLRGLRPTFTSVAP